MKSTEAILYPVLMISFQLITCVLLHPLLEIQPVDNKPTTAYVVMPPSMKFDRHSKHKLEQLEDIRSVQLQPSGHGFDNLEESHYLGQLQDSNYIEKQQDSNKLENYQRSNSEEEQLQNKYDSEQPQSKYASMSSKADLISLSKRASVVSIRRSIHELQQIEMYYQQLLVRGYLQESDVRRLEMLQSFIERLQSHLRTLLNAEQRA